MSVCTSCPTIAPGCATARPTGVVDPDGGVTLLNWSFNAWAKYANWRLDAQVGRAIADIARLPHVEPTRPDTGAPMVLEGGGIETNGAGLLLVTEEWLLSSVQVRNPGLTREGYEEAFARLARRPARPSGWATAARATTRTGTSTTSRASSPRDTIVLAVEDDPADENHATLDGQRAAARARLRAIRRSGR